MLSFKSSLLKTDVTSIKLHKEVIFCGIGDHVHMYKLNPIKQLLTFKAFDGLRIYGIIPNETKLLLHAENVLKIYSIRTSPVLSRIETCQDYACEAIDWILSAKWIKFKEVEAVVTLSMHNIIELYTNELKLVKTILCEQRCILYCGFLSYENWEDLVVFSGTVFSEVVLWKPCAERTNSKHLKGHQGVLFSIHHNPDVPLISSTSDDRSVVLWKINGNLKTSFGTCEIVKSHVLLGHSARVFGTKILSECVLSNGEDGTLNVWNFDGSLKRKIVAHQGGCVWVSDGNDSLIASGGSDAGVVVFPLENKRDEVTFVLRGEIPKKLVILSDGSVLVITESGGLFHVKDTYQEVDRIDQLRNYSLLEVSPCRKRVCLAGFKGHIYIYDLTRVGLKLVTSHQEESKGRIFSVHWLHCNLILTCGINGALKLWGIETKLILLHVMTLPKSKERWTTSACLHSRRILVGDRKGNLHLYSLESPETLRTFKAHNYLGVTALYSADNVLISLGRNAILRKFTLNSTEDQLIPSSSDKLPFTWLASLTQNILSAFSGSDFILWDYKTRRVILEIDCAGGHRSWDFKPEELIFAYIKDKAVTRLKHEWEFINPTDVFDGFHSSEINALTSYSIGGKLFLITGGEDTTLRLSRFDGRFETVQSLKSHLSSIRALFLARTKSNLYLFSAGGRAQIILWKINPRTFTCTEIYSHYEPLLNDESEIRVMDLHSCTINNETILLAACSDGKIKIYRIIDNGLSHASSLFYKLKCILKLTVIVFKKKLILVTMATDGFLVFWDLTETNPRPFFSLQVQQSGINSFSVCLINDTSRKTSIGGTSRKTSIGGTSRDTSSDTSIGDTSRITSRDTSIGDTSRITSRDTSIGGTSRDTSIGATSRDTSIGDTSIGDTYAFLTGGDDNALNLVIFKLEIDGADKIKVNVSHSYKNEASHCAQITGVYINETYFISCGLDQKVLIFKYKINENEIRTEFCGAYETTISDLKGMRVYEEDDKFIVVLHGLGLEILNIEKETNKL